MVLLSQPATGAQMKAHVDLALLERRHALLRAEHGDLLDIVTHRQQVLRRRRILHRDPQSLEVVDAGELAIPGADQRQPSWAIGFEKITAGPMKSSISGRPTMASHLLAEQRLAHGALPK